jgi:hypothetical protein
MTEDTKMELDKLQRQLAEDEEWFRRELDSAKRMIGQMPANTAAPRREKTAPCKTPAAQSRIQNPVMQEEPTMPKQKGIKGLLILATLEILGILGLGAFWVLVLLK